MLDLINEAISYETRLLFTLIFGPSGAGKSDLAGSAPGKILYIHTSGERHGVAAAKRRQGDIIPFCVDRDKSGATLTADQAFARGLAALDPEALKAAKITSVVLDGLTELEKLVRSTTTWANRCTTKTGKHDGFAETGATIELMDKYITALRRAQDEAGVHVVVTGILDVQEVDEQGAITLAKPRLTGYSVVEAMLAQFPDILVLGRMSDGATAGRVIQTGADLRRESKDQSGKLKKFINFTPRIAGVVDLPAFIKADLAEVIKLKGV